jgi:hypothetical protein
MPLRYVLIYLTGLLAMCCAPTGQKETNIILVQKNDTSFILTTSQSGKVRSADWKLNHPVFHFECADMNQDGTEDILVGVIKSTRFDPVNRKRIFIFKVLDGYIRPMWLGSRVSQPLEDFRIIHRMKENIIRTIELEKSGQFLVAEYRYKVFGLEFIHYLARNINQSEAYLILNNTIYKNETN